MEATYYNGSASKYLIVANTDTIKYGVAVEFTKTGFVFRFSTLGVTEKPPTHFNFRSGAHFKSDGQTFKGCYFDKIKIPVIAEPVSFSQFTAYAEQIGLADSLAEWVITQFNLEGVEVPPEVKDLILSEITTTYSGVDADLQPVFKAPKNIWHETKVYDKDSPAQKDAHDADE